MKKIEIMTDTFEARFGTSKASIPAMSAEEIFGSYISGGFSNSNDPQRVSSYDTEAEARAEFSRHYADYGRTRAEAGSPFWLLTGELAWIEENEYDDDGEFDQGGDVLDWSAEGYEKEEE